MKKESWMSDAGYATGVLESRRLVTAKRNPRNLQGRLRFLAAWLVLMAVVLTASFFVIKWSVSRIDGAFERAPASVEPAAKSAPK